MPLTITHAKSNTIADFTGTVTVGNSSGGTQTVAATNLVRPSDWNSGHQGTIAVAPNEMFGMGFFEPFPQPNTNSTLSAPAIGSWYLDPVFVPAQLSSGLIHMPMVGGASTNAFQDGAVWSATLSGSNTRYFTFINAVAFYDHGTGTASTRLESKWSNLASWMVTWERRHSGGTTSSGTISAYLTVSVPLNQNGSGGITYTSNSASGTTSYGGATAASTLASGLLTGPMRYLTGSRFEVIPLNSTLPAGEYWFAHMVSSSTSVTGTGYTGGTVITSNSRLGLLENNMNAYKRIGFSTLNATSGQVIFHGALATTTLSASSVIASSDMRATTGRAYWNFAQTDY